MFFFNLYHQISQKTAQGRKLKQPQKKSPEQWSTTFIKFYERFPLFPLPPPRQDGGGPLFSIIQKRRSRRKFGNAINKQILSELFYFSIGETNADFGNGIGQRVYPSGGARYPLEFYVLNFRDVENLTVGVYHYDIVAHGLRKIRNVTFDSSFFKTINNYTFLEDATFAIIFTACLSRSSGKYGESAYRYALLEAGGIMQNFSLVSESLSIDSVSIGNLDRGAIEALLDTDGNEEIFIHSMFFG